MSGPGIRLRPSAAALRGDLWLGVALAVAAILSSALGMIAGLYGEKAADPVWTVPYAVALGAVLTVRRRFPTVSIVLGALVFFAGTTLRVPDLYVGNVALFLTFYTVGAWVADRRRAFLVRAAVTAGMFLWLLGDIFVSVTGKNSLGLSQAGFFSPFAAFAMMQLLINVAFFGGAWYFGDRAWAQAVERRQLEQRTAELEHEREVTAAQAVALDRVRIARELHDVVAHHVSAMGVQAGAARTVLDRDAGAARTALVSVEDAARSALSELRRLLETLRTPASDPLDASTARLAALPELVAHAREHGLPTTLTVVGEPAAPPGLVELSLYRIAQEALTNARRHGGPDATADVRLRFEAEAIELEVANEGWHRTGRTGLGLLGMRERAEACGGSLEAGPRERGGFVVRARVPLPATTATDPAVTS